MQSRRGLPRDRRTALRRPEAASRAVPTWFGQALHGGPPRLASPACRPAARDPRGSKAEGPPPDAGRPESPPARRCACSGCIGSARTPTP
ncbi:hypothetical protein G6F40_018012 [Rhizopus arrhizus]|nr:hypothetical protein G6F40_018012 [Rhizopus arrhizus]